MSRSVNHRERKPRPEGGALCHLVDGLGLRAEGDACDNIIIVDVSGKHGFLCRQNAWRVPTEVVMAALPEHALKTRGSSMRHASHMALENRAEVSWKQWEMPVCVTGRNNLYS